MGTGTFDGEGIVSGPIAIFIAVIILIVSFVLIVSLVQEYAPELVWQIQRIVFTDHALDSHIEQKWNATTIYEYMESGNCNYDHCFVEDTELRFCQINDKYSILLVVGKTVQQVITGHVIETRRIDKKCKQ